MKLFDGYVVITELLNITSFTSDLNALIGLFVVLSKNNRATEKITNTKSVLIYLFVEIYRLQHVVVLKGTVRNRVPGHM